MTFWLRIQQKIYCPYISIKTAFMKMENSKKNKCNSKQTKLFLLVAKIRASKKHAHLQHWSYYYNRFKIIATKLNARFGLPDGSYSVLDIQDFIKYIIKNKKHYPLIVLLICISPGLIRD